MGGPAPDPNAPPTDSTDPTASQGQGFDPFSADPFNPVSPGPSFPFGGGGGGGGVSSTAPAAVVGTYNDPAYLSQQQGYADQSAQAQGAGQPSGTRQSSIADQLQKLLFGLSPVSRAQAADLAPPAQSPQAPSTGAGWSPSPAARSPSIELPQLQGGGQSPSIELPQLQNVGKPSTEIEPIGSEAVTPQDKAAYATRAGNFQDPATMQYGAFEKPERPTFPGDVPTPTPRPAFGVTFDPITPSGTTPDPSRPSVTVTDATPPAAPATAATPATPASTKPETVAGGTPVRPNAPTPDAVTAAQQQAGQTPQQQRGQRGLHAAIANLFGGGDLGNLVASLMLQLGVPAALIMAGRGHGGGRGFPLVGGRAAMGGGRGGGRFGPSGNYIGPQPQYGRQMFPGSGVPNWLYPAIAGQVLDKQPADQGQGQGDPLHPANAVPPGAQTPKTPGGVPQRDLEGGAEPGATPVKPVPAPGGGARTIPATEAPPADRFAPAPPETNDPMEKVPPSSGGQYVPPSESPAARAPIQASLTTQGAPGAAGGNIAGLFSPTPMAQQGALQSLITGQQGAARQPQAPTQQDIAATRIAGSDTRPTAGFSTYLRNQRAPLMREINSNPQLKLQVAALASFETPNDPMGMIEALMNRSALTNSTIQNRIWARNREGKTFYGPINAGLLNSRMIQLRNNPQELAKYYSAIDTVGQGTNLLAGATDQGSGNDPNVRNPSGRVIRHGETYNDWFPQAATWRHQQQAAIARERQQIPPANLFADAGHA